MRTHSIGIVGNGRFSKLLVKLLTEAGLKERVKIYARRLKSPQGQFTSLENLLTANIIIPCVPISQLATLAKQLQEFALNEKTTILDVASVKEYPVEIYQKYLPKVGVIASHPMFGPGNFHETEAALPQIDNLNMVISNVRGDSEVYSFIHKLFTDMGINMLEMSPTDHDRLAAQSQFITLFTAFTLKKYNFSHSKIDTKSAQVLKRAVDMVTIDKSLLLDMYRYNKYCQGELLKLKSAFRDNLSEFESV